VPRISPKFLEEERRSLPTHVYEAEYECVFGDTLENVFATEDVLDALSEDVLPLFGTHGGDATTDPVIVPLFGRQAAS
jgi:hypothetical protein